MQWKKRFVEQLSLLATQVELLDAAAFDPSLPNSTKTLTTAVLRCILDAIPELHGITCVFQWNSNATLVPDIPICHSVANAETSELVSALLRQRGLLHALLATTRDLAITRDRFEQELAETVRQLWEKKNELENSFAAENVAG